MTPAGNEIGVAMGQRRDQVKRSTLVPPLSVVDPLGRRLARTAVPASVIGGDQIGGPIGISGWSVQQSRPLINAAECCPSQITPRRGSRHLDGVRTP